MFEMHINGCPTHMRPSHNNHLFQSLNVVLKCPVCHTRFDRVGVVPTQLIMSHVLIRHLLDDVGTSEIPSPTRQDGG